MAMAPQGAPAPGDGSDPSSDPSQSPQGGAGGDAVKAIHMIQQGFMVLGKVMQSAGSQLDPQDIKLFQAAATATDDFIQALTGPAGGGGEQPPQRAQKSGPMSANENAGAKPAM